MKNINKLTETFAIDDSYFTEFDEVLEGLTSHDLQELKEIKVHMCILRKVVDLNKETFWGMIVDQFNENTSEDGDEWEKVRTIFNDTFIEKDFELFSSKMPSLWWPEGETITIPMSEILDYISKHEIVID